MNKFQALFFEDGRITNRNRRRKFIAAVSYIVFDWPQLRYLSSWLKSLKKGSNPLDDGKPWVTYSAVNYLDKIVETNFKVFEYGSGGSTIYFANKAEEVVSIEHDPVWFNKLNDVIKSNKLKNCNYKLVCPTRLKDVAGETHEYFSSTTNKGESFEKYVTSINGYPDKYFDLVSVDGRSRVACVREAYRKVKKGGFILLDNSDRQDYFEAYLFMKDRGAEQHNFFGLVGYEPTLAQTTIWRI